MSSTFSHPGEIGAATSHAMRRSEPPLITTQAVLDSLESGQESATQHAFISLTRGRALAEAAASTRRLRQGRQLGPLDGMGVAYKDLFDVACTKTTAGSPTRDHVAPAQEDAAVVASLAAAGMVCIGKTNLAPLAFSGLGVNPHFGTPRNPCDPHVVRVPGGSSSGAAVAVAAGVVPVALGSDTSGSVRVPAAWCGLVGYKASRTRYPRTGMLALAPSLDSIGIIARTVTEVIATDAILCGRPVPQPYGVRGLQLLLPSGALEDADDHTAAAIERALDRLARAGADILIRPVPALDMSQTLFATHGTLVAAEAARTHARLLSSPDIGRLDPRIVDRLRAGSRITADDVRALRRNRLPLRRRAMACLDGRLLVTATVRHGPPTLAELADSDVFARLNATALSTTMTLSYLDMPGVTIPVDPAASLPVGLLVSAPHGSDSRLLAAAASIQRTLE